MLFSDEIVLKEKVHLKMLKSKFFKIGFTTLIKREAILEEFSSRFQLSSRFSDSLQVLVIIPATPHTHVLVVIHQGHPLRPVNSHSSAVNLLREGELSLTLKSPMHTAKCLVEEVSQVVMAGIFL